MFTIQVINDMLVQVMVCHLGPLLQNGLTLIPAWIINYIHYNVWDEITYRFSVTVEV